ncbi:hypothetical protein TBLA_0A09200 [Henningerozyma blattae CBS 6284]|uniref:Golgi apparatus membrane protein TVP38 n=1 Tax=Henningerozyma blattae (strain ATCC 34711 / CBS 6284 / DSM 70876 / NBRC 10599 / NRRL Y-10934 / UCD 77-7) TaxID=1071380 RepID=I2GX56_HENB6|nr:hypothetical protein TBLA_0A09200 [Tetrapisispora blattae CBS 6284]CCH58708.1 hypothetical protein TBLA_0A09200 [Tetrapisispora blattae CBS 6284]
MPIPTRVSSNLERNSYDFNDFDSRFNDTNHNGGREEENFLDIYNMTPKQRMIYNLRTRLDQILDHYKNLPKIQQIAICIFGFVTFVLAILVLIFHKTILHKLVEMSNELRANWLTQFVLFFLIFCVGFPPMIGYSMLSTSTGLIYGVTLHGWIILASGSILGSVAAFTVFQRLLHSKAESLIKVNRKFEALAMILQQNNSYWILALLRLCPFPYSLTNGAIAAVYGVSIKNFTIANILTSPKLFIYLFIGSRIKNMGEDGTTAGSKLFDLISIVVTVIILSLTAWILYYKTQKKYIQLQRNDTQDLETPTIDEDFDI